MEPKTRKEKEKSVEPKSMTNQEYLDLVKPVLSKVIPYQWRVQSFNKSNTKATCVAYIDARQAMDLLDEALPLGWQRDYKTVKDSIYCGVGVNMPDGSTQWRWDVGTEGNFEAEKSQSSDAFKRSCVNWGIGRFLYDLEIMTVAAASSEYMGKTYPYVVDAQGGRVTNITDFVNSLTGGADLYNAIKAISGYTSQEEATKWAMGLPLQIKGNPMFRKEFSDHFKEKQ